MRRIYFSLIISALMTACSSGPEPAEHAVAVTVPPAKTLASKPELLQFYNEWHGTPYRLGGTQKSGIDCSAFVQKAFVEAYQLALPRTTKQQSKQGVELGWNEAKQGDLVFLRPEEQHIMLVSIWVTSSLCTRPHRKASLFLGLTTPIGHQNFGKLEG